MKNLFSLTSNDFDSFLPEKFNKTFTKKQIYSWLYKHRNMSIEDWSNLSKDLRSHLGENSCCSLPKISMVHKSQDGTLKFLVALADGLVIENVIIFTPTRVTQCISSQVGCPVKCSFCFTGKQGMKRNLKTEEIVGQYVIINEWLVANKYSEISNIVFMGQGEPLLNFESVLRSVEIFTNPIGIGLGGRKITVSTSGFIPELEQLMMNTNVNIAISLHSPFNNIRDTLVPINKKYKVEKLLQSIYQYSGKRKITFEYTMLDGVNDRMSDIEQLVKILRPDKSKINLIPFNTFPGVDYTSSSKEKILWFRDKLIKGGLMTTIRETKGDDVYAACGQLNVLAKTKSGI